MTGGGPGGTLPGPYGAMLLYENAGGYVLTGLLSFAAAVVSTVFSMRRRARKNNKDKKRDAKEREAQ